MRSRFLFLVAALSLSIASCTTLLGDFSVAGGADAGGPDVAAGDDASAGGEDVSVVVPMDASDAPADGASQADAAPGLAAPQPLWPMSTAFSTTRRPTFKWKLPPGEDGAHVDVCVDRACTTVVASFDATGAQGTPSQDLPPSVVFWRLRGRSGSQTGTTFSPTWELVVPQKSAPVATAWGTLLDLNGDGYGDLAVGAVYAPSIPDGGTGPGRVYVYLGGSAGIQSGQTPIVLDAPDPGMFGSVLTSAGDVNGDGFGDLLVEAAGVDNGTGRAYLYLGDPSGPGSKPAVIFLDPNPVAQTYGFGENMASLGDMDGDGYGDIAIWNPGGSLSYIYRGGPSGPSATPSSSAWPSLAFITNVGDMNGDGHEDIAGTTRNSSNVDEVDVYFGSAQGFPQQPSVKVPAKSSMDFFVGPELGSAGDVNADGYADLMVVDSPIGTNVISVLVYDGSSNGPSTGAPSAALTNPAPPDGGTSSNYGASFSTAGDMAGLGYSSVVVTDPTCPIPSGCAYLWVGGAGGFGSSPSATLTTPDGGVNGGYSVTSGDFDGDGLTEFCFGAASDGHYPEGVVSIVGSSGGSGPQVIAMLHGPDGPRGQFGWSVAGR